MTESGASRLRLMIKQELRENEVEMCRLCVGRSPDYFPVFTENLPQLLSTHLGVSLSETDNWPKFVCSGCVEKVHEIVKFIDTVRESENILRNLFGERETIPCAVNTASGEPGREVKEEKAQESTMKTQDSGILRQMLLGEISKCSYMNQKPPVPQQTTSLLRDQLLKPLPPRIVVRKPPVKRSRKRNIWSPEDIEALHSRIESFYSLTCDICKETFAKFRDLEEHFREIHSRNAYILCCKLKFSGFTNLNDHLIFHDDPEAFKCRDCGKCFKYQVSLDFHTINTHTPHEMRGFQCPNCPQRFVTGKMLKQHAMVHQLREKIHTCPHCRRTFERKASVRKHIRTFHEAEDSHRRLSSDESYECHLCGEKSHHKFALRTHMNVVHLKRRRLHPEKYPADCR